MGSWLSVILILLIFLTGGYVYLRRTNRLPDFLSNLSSNNSTKTLKNIESSIEAEEEKAQELRTVLSAKQKLARAKAVNTALRKEIRSTNESSVIVPRNILLENDNAKKKEKV